MLPESLSVVHPSQHRALVQGDVVGLVALDFILWLSLARVVGVPFVINVFTVHLDDPPDDVPSLRVPGYVIAHLEISLHTARLGLDDISPPLILMVEREHAVSSPSPTIG